MTDSHPLSRPWPRRAARVAVWLGRALALLALVIGAAGQWETARGGALARRAGDLSFSLYITHLFTGLIWFNAVRALALRYYLPLDAQWLLWALALPLAFGVAITFEAVIDRPAQALLTGGLWRRRVQPAL